MESTLLTSSAMSAGTNSKILLIGIGPTTIELLLPGSATVKLLTVRSVPVPHSETTGTRLMQQLQRTPRHRQTWTPLQSYEQENEPEERSSQGRENRRPRGTARKSIRM
uniref:Apoptin n=1 Tax=Gyrovirus 10 TaxID=2218660 RepID=A0A2U9N7A6_9VIRU|nr:VP3 [Gyrovirus 10]